MLKNKRILVTGAGGFLGKQVVKALLADGVKAKKYLHPIV